MAYDYRWYKKQLEELRTLTKGTMELGVVCKDEKELKAYKDASKGMRNIKNLEFKLKESERRSK